MCACDKPSAAPDTARPVFDACRRLVEAVPAAFGADAAPPGAAGDRGPNPPAPAPAPATAAPRAPAQRGKPAASRAAPSAGAAAAASSSAGSTGRHGSPSERTAKDCAVCGMRGRSSARLRACNACRGAPGGSTYCYGVRWGARRCGEVRPATACLQLPQAAKSFHVNGNGRGPGPGGAWVRQRRDMGWRSAASAAPVMPRCAAPAVDLTGFWLYRSGLTVWGRYRCLDLFRKEEEAAGGPGTPGFDPVFGISLTHAPHTTQATSRVTLCSVWCSVILTLLQYWKHERQAERIRSHRPS